MLHLCIQIQQGLLQEPTNPVIPCVKPVELIVCHLSLHSQHTGREREAGTQSRAATLPIHYLLWPHSICSTCSAPLWKEDDTTRVTYIQHSKQTHTHTHIHVSYTDMPTLTHYHILLASNSSSSPSWQKILPSIYRILLLTELLFPQETCTHAHTYTLTRERNKGRHYYLLPFLGIYSIAIILLSFSLSPLLSTLRDFSSTLLRTTTSWKWNKLGENLSAVHVLLPANSSFVHSCMLWWRR